MCALVCVRVYEREEWHCTLWKPPFNIEVQHTRVSEREQGEIGWTSIMQNSFLKKLLSTSVALPFLWENYFSKQRQLTSPCVKLPDNLRYLTSVVLIKGHHIHLCFMNTAILCKNEENTIGISHFLANQKPRLASLRSYHFPSSSLSSIKSSSKMI